MNTEIGPPGPGSIISYLNVNQKNGILLRTLQLEDNQNFNSISLRKLLFQLKDSYVRQINNFKKDTARVIERNDIWTYRKILSYSINIFFTGNMVPKTKLANVIFFLHELITVTFLLGITVGLAQNLFFTNNTSHNTK